MWKHRGLESFVRILSSFSVIGGSLPFRIVSPFAAPRVPHRTGGLVAHSPGAIPIPTQTAGDSHAPANLVAVPRASR